MTRKDLAPCPYHKPDQDCGKTGKCPILILEGAAKCMALMPAQILMVRSWVEGRIPDREEA